MPVQALLEQLPKVCRNNGARPSPRLVRLTAELDRSRRLLDTYGHLFPAIDVALTDGLERTYRATVADGSWCSRGADVVQQLPRREAAAP